MDDIQEYAQMRREAESQHKRSVHQTTAATTAGSASKTNGKASQSAFAAASSGGSSNGAGAAATASVNDTVAIVVDAVARQTRAEAIRERIGFDPTPRNS